MLEIILRFRDKVVNGVFNRIVLIKFGEFKGKLNIYNIWGDNNENI